MFIKTAAKIYVMKGRYKIEVEEISAGNLVLIEGIDGAISKSSTIVHFDQDHNQIGTIIPLKFWT